MTDEPDDNVVTIGEMHLARIRRYERDPKATCAHSHLQLDDEGDIVLCTDCGRQLSAFWVLDKIRADLRYSRHQVEAARERVAWEAKKHVILRAAKQVDECWRRKMAPECPFCRHAILPEDGLAGPGFFQMNANDERERRTRAKATEVMP